MLKKFVDHIAGGLSINGNNIAKRFGVVYKKILYGQGGTVRRVFEYFMREGERSFKNSCWGMSQGMYFSGEFLN